MVKSIKEITLSKEDRIPANGSSNGAQPKYFKDGIWYKKDLCGGEGYSEYLASLVLKSSNLQKSQYVEYTPCKINGQMGCSSPNFLSMGESYMDLMTLYKYVNGGRDFSAYLMDKTPEERFSEIVYFMQSVSQLPEKEIKIYLANLIAFDKFILNEDRNLKNIGFVFDGNKFKFAPIFDNGRSFFVGQGYYNESLSMRYNIDTICSKPFSSSFEKQYEMVKSYITMKIDANKLKQLLSEEPDSIAIKLLKYQIEHEDICINYLENSFSKEYDELEDNELEL